MLLSMTGYGEARGSNPRLHLTAEVRSVNNRHLKLALRAPEPYSHWENEFEKLVRKHVRRGTVALTLRCDRVRLATDFKLDPVALRSYADQILGVWTAMRAGVVLEANALFSGILALPGVVAEPAAQGAAFEDDWPLFEAVVGEALGKLQAMRQDEGGRMAQELLAYRATVADELARVRERVPHVVEGYRARLVERVRGLIGAAGASVTEADLIREVAIFAERSDVAEEIVRLDSHLTQFAEIIDRESDGPGRKLEFVAQEMGRETNTIGSKASDVAVSRHVVEIKATLEKVRELIQNVE